MGEVANYFWAQPQLVILRHSGPPFEVQPYSFQRTAIHTQHLIVRQHPGSCHQMRNNVDLGILCPADLSGKRYLTEFSIEVEI